jgi:protoheme IX farnesyltransferase
MAGVVYLIGAAMLGGIYFYFATRLGAERLPPSSAQSKKNARDLLRVSVLYLPLLFALMMLNVA